MTCTGCLHQDYCVYYGCPFTRAPQSSRGGVEGHAQGHDRTTRRVGDKFGAGIKPGLRETNLKFGCVNTGPNLSNHAYPLYTDRP